MLGSLKLGTAAASLSEYLNETLLHEQLSPACLEFVTGRHVVGAAQFQYESGAGRRADKLRNGAIVRAHNRVVRYADELSGQRKFKASHHDHSDRRSVSLTSAHAIALGVQPDAVGPHASPVRRVGPVGSGVEAASSRQGRHDRHLRLFKGGNFF
jgi:hypothetical protein